VSGHGRFDLAGKVAIVTGASRGIGRALALGFADAGAAVVCAARTLDACEEVAREIVAAGGRAVAVRTDIGDLASHAALVETARAEFGRLDVLVNNAGVLKPHVTVRVTEAELDRMYDINLKGPLFLSVAALDLLAADGGGAIVNIGALCATQPMEGIGAYCAIKAAMANWSTTMAREWAARGVRVNTLVPGSIATDMILPVDPVKRAAFTVEMAEQTLFKRLGQPEDLVGAAIFLATDASAFMTGRSIFVDGGLLR
jgi:NAD(P)-dependent dehydrogenase (short-subunit alcohol dehydrogenase family)